MQQVILMMNETQIQAEIERHKQLMSYDIRVKDPIEARRHKDCIEALQLALGISSPDKLTHTQKKEISSNLRQAIAILAATLEQLCVDDYLNRGSLEVVDHNINQAKLIADGTLHVE